MLSKGISAPSLDFKQRHSRRFFNELAAQMLP